MRAHVLEAFLLACIAGAAAAQRPQELDYPALLQRMVDVDWWWQPPAVGERCVQFSSYDRKSDGHPKDMGKWYANHDRGNYLRVVDNDGVTEHVMVDASGPGCLARLWSANPGGMIHFDVDGERVWSVDFGKLCRGEIEGVPEPLAGMRSRGGNLYLPVPFQKSLVVSAEDGDLYYLADVMQFAAGTNVPSFATTKLSQHADEIAAVANGVFPMGQQWVSGMGSVKSRKLGPGKTVTSFIVHYEDTPLRDLEGIVLRVTCGGEETVRVPLLDFFAVAADGATSLRSSRLRVGKGFAECLFPMPMPKVGHVELLWEGEKPEGVRLDTVQTKPLADENPLLFRANYHVVKGTPTRPFSDHVVLDAKGRGRFVGCSLLVCNPSRIWWGEGDEKFYVDGEAFPSWFGTGTEDYFGYAWCEPTPFQAPFHAQVVCQGPKNFGFTQLHRTHVLDSVPFQQSFRFDLERWHWIENIKMDYATVAYWYGEAGATSGLPDVPPLAERKLEPLLQPKTFFAENALEGERLRVVSCSGGVHQVQDLSVFEELISSDEHRWWRDGKVGDALVLAVPVAVAGRYRVTTAMVTANDFAIVQLSMAGQKLGKPFDGFSVAVGSTGPRFAGEVDLAAGDNELRFEIVGKNEMAKNRHMVGLDYIKLEKVK